MKQIEKRYLDVLEKHDWAVSSHTEPTQEKRERQDIQRRRSLYQSW